MKRRACLALGMGTAAAGVLRPCAARAAVEWSCYTYVPAATLTGARGMQRIVDGVGKATNGGLRIAVNLAGSLPISATTITQAVASGVMQMGDDGFYQGNIPIAGILQLPMLMDTPQQFATALAVMRPYVERAYAKKGIVLLGGYYFPPQVAWSRRRLESLADLRGQRMRVSSPQQAAFVQAFGGIAETLGAEEVPTALDRGVIQGVFTASAGGGRIWQDLLKYNYRLGPNYFNSYIIANQAAFARLPPDAQAALRSVVTEVTPSETAELYQEEQQVTAELRKGGMIVTEAKPADVALGIGRMKGYWEQWARARGPEAADALAKVRAAIGR